MTHNLQATVFVYKSKADGSIRAEYINGAMVMGDDWIHLATLEPRMWIQYHYEDVEKIALKVEEMGMQGFGTLAIAAAIRRGYDDATDSVHDALDV